MLPERIARLIEIGTQPNSICEVIILSFGGFFDN
jgi:hypothetical protein